MDSVQLNDLYLVNSKSGKDDEPDWDVLLKNHYKAKAEKYEIFPLPEKIELDALREKILSKNPGKLIAVGGDGTVSLAASIIAGTDIKLGIIPQGSANGMAKELNIPEKIDAALQIIHEGEVKNCDLIKIKEYGFCLHMADLGLNAHLIKHFEQGEKRGMLGYALVIFKTLARKRKMVLTLNTKGETVHRVAYMVALANASKYGTGAVINPKGKLDDGFFEVVVVRRLNFGSLLKMLFKPGLFNPEKIEIFTVNEVKISSKHKMHFQVDGEYKGKVHYVNAEVAIAAVKILVEKK